MLPWESGSFASATVMRRPPTLRPFSSLTAFVASAWELMSTKPKPRDWPVALSVITAVDSQFDLNYTLSTQWNFNGGAFTSGLPAWLAVANNGCTQAGGLSTCTWTLAGTALSIKP